MAILDTNILDGPLRQGDLLNGIIFIITTKDGDPDKASEHDMGMVISRHCKAARSENILIAGIRPYRAAPLQKIIDDKPSLGEVRRRFDYLRNGVGEPDSFYLGTLPLNETDRFQARLDYIYTIELPVDAEERKSWISQRRFARLSDEHRRHLHSRLFVSISSEGFDDFQSWADADLELLMLAGKREIRESEDALDIIKSKMNTLDSNGLGASQHTKRKKSMEQTKLKLETELQSHIDALRPYQNEFNRRRNIE